MVQPSVRASTIARDLLAQVITPIDADEIFQEEAKVDHVRLYFRPICAFEYSWAAQEKTAVIEFDGATGEMRTDGKTARLDLRTVISRDLMFDIGAEAVNLVVPGRAIALRLAEHFTSQSQRKG